MKSLMTAAAALAVATIAPAMAHAASPITGYANLGYSYADYDPAKLHVLDGKLGARFGKYVGLEGEAGFGVGNDTISGIDFKVKSTYAGYAIGFLPLSPKADLFARVGYGHDSLKGSLGGVSATVGRDSLNFGGGAQFFFTNNDGFRAEFTRHDLRNGGGEANVYSISYVRKFQ
jgi:hypothetical protein